MTIPWIPGDKQTFLTGRGNPTHPDTLNAALRAVLAASGIDPDIDFGAHPPLTRAAYRAARAMGDHWVTDPYYGAAGDGVTNDAAAIQGAIQEAGQGGRVRGPYRPNGYNLGEDGIVVARHIAHLDLSDSELKYHGGGVGLDFQPNDGVTYPVSVGVKGVNVRTTVEGAIAIRSRTSYSKFSRCGAVLMAPSQVGWDLPGDSNGGGTGPYYNSYYDCQVQGQGGEGQVGIRCAPSDAETMPSRTPNVNKWWGGRVGQVATGVQVMGAGNRFWGITAETCDVSFDFNNPDQEADPVHCSVHGAYLENAGIGFRVGANARGIVIEHPYLTGVGTPLVDLAPPGSTRYISNDQSLVPAEGLVWAMRAAGLWPTVEGSGAGFRARLPAPDGRGWTAAVGAASSEANSYFELTAITGVLLAALGTVSATFGAKNLLLANSDFGFYSGNGSPEGVLAAGLASYYADRLNGDIYVKKSAPTPSTGWVLK